MGRLRQRLDGLEAHAHSTLSGADTAIALAKDAILDARDGAGVTFAARPGFSEFANRLIRCVGSYLASLLIWQLRSYLPFIKKAEEPTLDLAWMEVEGIPVLVQVDLEVDILPAKVSQFVGGPYDGHKFVVDQRKPVLVLEPNHRYVWDGKAFAYRGTT